ncbi:transporter substrate-binding domain-containing protein [Opitutus sp. ER46]|uniref:transporter substrate-binding domain-containing protein n=1 Tax=Opitutus sp. ER46 TaxID=2161864 RepID=UPI000D2FEB45|nr:transporter substrate-binding domain-containing protein [Opitutus sp. ER46]PTX98548.1 hypothetical protein DB354_04605 [Opitutus sp. ER46]
MAALHPSGLEAGLTPPRFFLLTFGITRRFGLFALVLACAAGLWAEDGPEGALPRDLSRPVVVATSEVFFPYQYRDRNGALVGFANDVTDAVARAVGLHLERVPIANTDMGPALQSGRVDVLQFWSETPERREWAEFSVPIARFETVAVVRKGDSRIRQLSDLKGRRVAVGQRGTVGHRFLETEMPEATPVFTETTEQFLRLLAAGGIDAAVMSRLTAIATIDHLGLDNLRVLDDRITGDAYDVRYCFTVRRGDSMLLSRLNEGLAIVHRNGQFDAIYDRWFGRYEGRRFTALQVMSYVAITLALACAAVSWGLLRQRTLSKHVKEQAAQLSAQSSLLAALFDNHPLATLVIEVRGSDLLLISANPEALRLFRLPTDLSLPTELSRVTLPQEVRLLLGDAVHRVRTNGTSSQWEARIAERQRLIEMTVLPIGHSEDGAHRVCLLSNDVTQRRLIDNELAQSRRLRALGELVGGIAHEFNNLLTPIIVTTSQARAMTHLSPELQADFTVIDNAARRAAELTKRLLTFGRKNDERRAMVGLAEAAENCFALLRSTVDRRVEWAIRAPRDLPPLFVNPTDLNQIVFNLVINARDTLLEKLAQPHDSRWSPRLTVTITELGPADYAREVLPPGASTSPFPENEETSLRHPLGWQRITVEDNGLGIPPEHVERVFEPFFTTKAIGQGTGLGLATVWHLVNELGGEISLESKLGEGTSFFVTLPQWPKPADKPAPGHPAHRPIGLNRGLRILLAEDDPLVTRAAMAVLERAGHLVIHCIDGSEAWNQLTGNGPEFQVLLLDLNMPRLNGIDLIRRVRRSNYAGAIVVMSGRVSDEERQALGELQVDRLVNKPFSAGDLIEALQALPPLKRSSLPRG